MQGARIIVVGVDFTERSHNALREAIRLCGPNGNVHAVHIVESQAVDEMRRVLQTVGITEQSIMTQAKVRLGEMVNGLFNASQASQSASVNIEVVAGHPSETLVQLVDQLHADLLVLARNSTSDPDGGAGTCAVNCVRNAKSNVLLVRESHQGPYQRVMACVDFSADSRLALMRAAALAERDQAELHVVHAFRPPWEVVPFAAVPMAAAGDYQTEHLKLLESQLDQLRQTLVKAHPSIAITLHLEPAGSVGSTLVSVAESINADLAVLGTHGRGRIARMLLGSTAERVIRSAACSVWTVRLPQEHEPAAE